MPPDHVERSREPVGQALADGRRRVAGHQRTPTGPGAVLALQRQAGNAAVSALLAAKVRAPGVTEIDAALREVRTDDPVIDTVEKGLKEAKAAGVPVELEGPKPPASALAVTKTGFGPAAVPSKKPVAAEEAAPRCEPVGQGLRGQGDGGWKDLGRRRTRRRGVLVDAAGPHLLRPGSAAG